MSYITFGQILCVQNTVVLGQLGLILYLFCPKIFHPKSFSLHNIRSHASFVQMIFVQWFLVQFYLAQCKFCPNDICPLLFGPCISLYDASLSIWFLSFLSWSTNYQSHLPLTQCIYSFVPRNLLNYFVLTPYLRIRSVVKCENTTCCYTFPVWRTHPIYIETLDPLPAWGGVEWRVLSWRWHASFFGQFTIRCISL